MSITVVQTKSGTGTSLTLTSSTTAGNCLVVGFTDEGGATSVTAATLGGAAGNFAQLASAEGTPSFTSVLAALWADPNCTGGQTAVAVTASGSSAPTIWCIEVSGILSASPLDKQTGTTGTATSWSSGSTATTTQASEIWVGAVCNASSSSTTGPSSPWVNTSVSDGSSDLMFYGYDIVSSTGAASYAGAGGSSKGWAAVVATLKASPAPSARALLINQAVKRAAYY